MHGYIAFKKSLPPPLSPPTSPPLSLSLLSDFLLLSLSSCTPSLTDYLILFNFKIKVNALYPKGLLT